METDMEIQEIVTKLDAQRCAMGMSYQDLADACEVSKATIYRVFVGKTRPTAQLLQNIAATVQYTEKNPEIFPDELTQEAYIAYLKQLVRQKDEAIELRAKQLHSHYNKLLRQSKRRETIWAVLALVFMATFIVLFLYDFSHLDRGWIQAAYNGYKSTAYNVFLALESFVRRMVV